VVLTEVAAAALLALDRRPRDAFGNGQEVAQVEARVPARVVLAMADDTDARGALLELLNLRQRLPHLVFQPDDPDECLHRLLKIRLHFVRILAAVAAFEWLERCLHRAVNGAVVYPRLAVLPDEVGGVFTRALSEHDQVG